MGISARRLGRDRRAPSKRSSAFTPATIFGSNCVLWLTRDVVTLSGSDVTAWPDQSGNGNNGTGVNNPQLTGNVVVFASASSQRVSVADSASLDLTTAMTIGMRVRPDSLGTMCWLSKGPTTGGSYSVQYSGELRFWTGAPGVNGQAWTTAAAGLVAGTWTSLIIVYGSSAVSLYANGSLVTPGTTYGTIPASLPVGTDPVNIAAYSNPAQFFDAAFGSIVIANVAANAQQRADLLSYLNSTGP